MRKKELANIRLRFGKTQDQMAQLLGVSLKAVQSFEQGWRRIPLHIERQALFLLALERTPFKTVRPCWAIRQCPQKAKRNCPAWEFQAGHLCWFINGTVCDGKVQESWREKMKVCRQCLVFQTIFPPYPPSRARAKNRQGNCPGRPGAGLAGE